MINLLSAEIYKLRKSKSFKVAAGLSVLFTTAIYLLQKLLLSGIAGNVDEAMIEEISNFNISHMLQQMFGNCNTIIFVTIFVCLFALGDYSSGAMKNIVGKGLRREEIYLARFLVTEFGAVMIYLLTALTVFIGSVIVQGIEQINGAVLYDFISYLSLQILYLTAYTAIIILVCEITRNTAGIFISILGVMLFSNIIFQGIDIVIKTAGAPFALSKYWITSVIASCPTADIPPQFITSSGIAAGVWLIVSLTAGMLCFSWKDVK